MQFDFELGIIGAGPIGLSCAIEAQKAGIDYMIFEKGTLANSIYNYPTNMTFFSTSEKLELDGIPFTSIAPKPNRQEALEYYRRVAESRHIKMRLYEGVDQMKKSSEGFQLITPKGKYNMRFLVLATGFYDIPNSIGVPGEDLPKVFHYYKEPWPFVRQKVVVVGANNSAVDAALECWRKGAEVTMVIRGDAIGEKVKYWKKPDIENRIKEGSINAYFNSNLKEITQHTITVNTPDGEDRLDNDFVLAMTGYHPNYRFFEQLGVEWGEDRWKSPCYDEEHHETNVPGLYLAGVVCGGMNTREFFIENSIDHAGRIVRHIQQTYRRQEVKEPQRNQ